MLEEATDLGFGDYAGFDFLEEGPAVRVLQHHVGDVALLLEVVVDQPHDVRVFQLLVDRDFVLRVLIVDLPHYQPSTILIATSSFVSVFLASLTIP